VLHARVGDGTSVAVDSGKFLGKILQWRLITERQNIENLMQVRIALEGLTAASVAVNGTAEDVRSLKLLLDDMKMSLNDRDRFSVLDLEFHVALAKASGNSLALDLISMIRGQLARALSRVLVSPNARPLSLMEHVRIIDNIQAGDAEGARNAMDIHLHAALERYRKTVGKVPHAKNGTSGKTYVGGEKGSKSKRSSLDTGV
jgi:GntR family transcriptional repressor for pyruvate dehydrogenase complex